MTRKIPVAQTKVRPEQKPGRKGRRRRSRELALQGLYQWFVAGGTIQAITEQLYETKEFLKTDQEYFSDGIFCRQHLNAVDITNYLCLQERCW